MSAAPDYLAEDQAPTRQQVDATPGLVLVEFGTAWCGYCSAIAPVLAEILSARPDIQHIKVEDGAGRPLGRSFTVRLWPNLVLMRDGAVVQQLARPGLAELRAAFAAFR